MKSLISFGFLLGILTWGTIQFWLALREQKKAITKRARIRTLKMKFQNRSNGNHPMVQIIDVLGSGWPESTKLEKICNILEPTVEPLDIDRFKDRGNFQVALVDGHYQLVPSDRPLVENAIDAWRAKSPILEEYYKLCPRIVTVDVRQQVELKGKA